MKILSYIFAGMMLLSAVGHLAIPEVYNTMIPDFVPNKMANILAFVSELVVGILLILPKYRHVGGLAFMFLMLVFLPIHILDALKDQPAIGSKVVAIVRIGIQFVLIYLGLRIYTVNRISN